MCIESVCVSVFCVCVCVCVCVCEGILCVCEGILCVCEGVLCGYFLMVLISPEQDNKLILLCQTPEKHVLENTSFHVMIN